MNKLIRAAQSGSYPIGYVHNLDDCSLSFKNGSYGGLAGSKDGIVLNGANWLVKYPKNISLMKGTGNASYSTSPLSEYIGSHIFEILGFDVHTTILGVRNNKLVVACKDFVEPNQMLLEIRTIKNYANPEMVEMFDKPFNETGSSHCVELEELLLHIRNNPILKDVYGIEKRFWGQTIVDILINNNDRNNGNWGILRTQVGDLLAPVFDNGASFQPKASEEKIESMLLDVDKVKENACNTQVAYGKDGHVFSSAKFLDIILENELGVAELDRLVPIILESMYDIEEFIDNIPESYNGISICSYARKELYKLQMRERCNKLLWATYNKIVDDVLL